MNIFYIANSRIPTEKAHGIQIMKTCEAFAAAGFHVTLIVPYRRNPIKDDPFIYYDMKRNFTIKKISTPDLIVFGKIGYMIQSLFFALSAAVYCLVHPASIIFSRDEFSLYFLSFFRKDVTWEAHTSHTNFAVRRLLSISCSIVTITQGLLDHYKKRQGVRAKFFVASDGVDIEKFSVHLSQEECRRKLQLPMDKKIIMYTGHLYEWKGVYTLAHATPFLPMHCVTVFVGGTEKDIIQFHKKTESFKNVLIVGKKPYHDMPLYIKAADILVLPNSAKEDISRLYTSPMKLFEYMASGNPIITSDLPSIREVLNDNNAFFVEPDNPQALASGITTILNNPQGAKRRALQSLHDVGRYSWHKRAENIINFLK